MKIGALLVRLRKEKELSEKDLGGLIKMSDAYINLLENDKRTPSLQTLIKLAAALEVHPTFFFPETFSPEGSLPDRKKSAVKVKIPFYQLSYLSGFSTESQETISVEYDLDNADPAAVQISDDSMLPDFFPWDIVIIDRKYDCETDRKSGAAKLRKKVVSGNFVICDITKDMAFYGRVEGLFRRIEINENGKNITLHPLNTAYEKRVLNVRSDSYYEKNVDVLHVLGKVIKKIKFTAIPLKE